MPVSLRTIRRLAAAAACLVATGGNAHAQGQAFDGTWFVLTKCPVSFDGAAAYLIRYSASVTNGVLHGEYGVKGEPSYTVMDGTIAADGTSMLRVHGLTGDPAYTIGHPKPAMPFEYHVQAQLQARTGTGKRVEMRPCEITFTKQ